MKRPLLDRATSLSNLLSNLRHRKTQSSGNRLSRGRRLRFEQCEIRNLLAGASITGFVYATAHASGFTPGADIPMGGVTIDLIPQGSPNPETTAISGSTGEYLFNNVADGEYKVAEDLSTLPAGFTQSAGPTFYTVDVVSGVVYSSSPTAQTTETIDGFTAPNPANAFFPPPGTTTFTLSPEVDSSILGGQRDVTINTQPPGANGINPNGFVGVSMPFHAFNLAAGLTQTDPASDAVLTYNGVGGSGLGAAGDLTVNGSDGILVGFDFLQGLNLPMNLQIVATGPAGSATVTQPLQSGNSFNVYVPFSAFTTSGAFSFADVNSLQFTFNGNGVTDVDMQVNQISLAGFNFGNFAVSKRLFLTPGPGSPATGTPGAASFSFNSTTGRLDVDGTTGNDAVSIGARANGNAVVTVNGHVLTNSIPLLSIQQLDIFGSDGNDTITLTNILKSVFVDAGASADHLIVNGAPNFNNFVLSGSQLFLDGAQYNLGNLESLSINGRTKDDVLLVQSATAFSTAFNGGGGRDTLIGPNTANNWNITGPGSGTLNSSFTFTAVESLDGGSGSDAFNYGVSGKLSGLIDGGGGSNTLNFGSVNKPVTVNLQNRTATLLGSFNNLQSFIGGTKTDTLIGPNQADLWAITGSNSGSVNGATFSSFENLTGGSGADTFQFASGGSISGKINGGAGIDKLDYSLDPTAATVNLQTLSATGAGGFAGIEGVIGLSNTTLVGANKNAIWNITGADSGTVNGFSFSGVGNLTGGGKNDTFVFADSTTLSGKIDGGAGFDTLNYLAYSTIVTVDLSTGTATNVAGGIASIENVLGA